MSNSINFIDERNERMINSNKGICSLVYNRNKKTFIGRTASSWGKILTFYFTYYLSLSAFFLSMIMVFMNCIIDNDVPCRTGLDSLLKLEPGLGFRPVPDHTSSLIKFVINEQQSYITYVSDIRTFLTPYEDLNIKDDSAFARCENGGKVPDDVNKICRYNLASLGNCTSTNNYGFSDGKPCIFLKMNKVYGWIPDTTDKESPRVVCEGMNTIDKINIGEIRYYPSYSNNDTKGGAFDHNFFPYLAQNGYLAPIVAVQFTDLKKEMVVMVRCYLDNLKYKKDMLTFEVMVD